MAASLSLFVRVLLVLILVRFLQITYRLTFHPLAKFRGPKLAAITHWWLYFQDRSRRVEQNLKKLHEKYDCRVLRIGPNELHIDEPSAYDDIYSAKQRFLKEPYFYAGFNAPNTVFSEDRPAFHRVRRKMVSPFFSKQGVAVMQLKLSEKVDMLIDKILAYKSMGPIHIYSGGRCMTVDIISEYAFGESFGMLDAAKDNRFKPELLGAFDLVLESVISFTYFPPMRIMSNLMPSSIAAMLDSKISSWLQLFQTLDKARISFRDANISGAKFERAPIFQSLAELPDSLMMSEAVDIIVAGSDTSATTLGVLIHNILANPAICKKLVADLTDAIPDKTEDPQLAKLEQIDYLTACVKESLRYALPVPGRLPRIVPKLESGDSPFVVDGQVIPSGVVVGMSAFTMHFSEVLWGKDANEFRPERWLQPDAKQLEKHLVTFSKGARQCLGINLVYAELRITAAKIFRRLDLTLDLTVTEKDLNQLDCFTASFEGTGTRVIVHGERP